jgi:dynein light chain LC8-type
MADTTATSTDASLKDTAAGAGGPKAIIKNVDMSEEMQQESVDIASAALEKYNIEKDIAAQIKKEFDRRHGPTWHVVVGKNFGSYVTHGEFTPVPPFFVHLGHTCLTRDAHCRNETLYLLLHRLAGYPHLEVIEPSTSTNALSLGLGMV